MPQYSIIDDVTHVDNENWVISLVTAKHHALLIIEGYEDNDFFTKLCDFLPTNSIGGDIFSVKFKNQLMPGRVRVVELANRSHRTLLDTLKARYELCDITMRSWSKNADDIRKLLTVIEQEEILPPQYQESGKERIGAKAHNCITWTIEKLKQVGIQLEVSTCTCLQNKLIGAQPETQTGIRSANKLC